MSASTGWGHWEVRSRRPKPDLRLDLYGALAAAAAAALAYVLALSAEVLPQPGFAVMLSAATPVCAAVALMVLADRARAEADHALGWVAAGLAVALVAMVLHLAAFPEVSAAGGPLGTDDDSQSTLYLLFHLAPAAGAAAGALRVDRRWRVPFTVGGVAAALLVALDAVPLPHLLRGDGSFTPLLVGIELVLAGMVAAAALAWTIRSGRSSRPLRGWVGVALSLSVYDLVLNAEAASRFDAVWWSSLSLRVATYAVLAGGATASVLRQLRRFEIYSDEELDRREDDLRRSLEITERLLAFAKDLGQAVSPGEVSRVLVEDAAAATGLSRAAVAVVDEGTTSLRLLACEGCVAEDPAGDAPVPPSVASPAPRVLSTGVPAFLESPTAVCSEFPALCGLPVDEAGCLAALPLVLAGTPVGVLVVWDEERHDWSRLEREVLVGLAAQGAQALERAKLYERQRSAAETLQRALLPGRLPSREDLALSARYLPGERGLHVGGDWYDCVELADGQVALVVGDVMGKGMRAATLMAQIRSSLRALAAVDSAPGTVLSGVNRITHDLDTDEIATVAYVLLNPGLGVAHVAQAGHLPVVLVPPDAPPRLIEGGLSPPLGAPVTEERREVRVDVPPGSVFLLYTDGMVEDRRVGLDAGLSALLDSAGRLVAEHGEDVDGLAAALLAAARSEERSDDIALLVARSTGRDGRARLDVPGGRTRSVRPAAVRRGAAVHALPVRLEVDARRSTGDDVLESVP